MTSALDLDSSCRHLAAPYLHPASGAMVAVATPEGTHFAPFGRVSANIPIPPTPHTLFEIGSITKVFTAILLAKMSLDGRIGIDHPIAAIAPEFKAAPPWITPRALATHRSGLPRIPFSAWQIHRTGVENPYAQFSRADLVAWLSSYKPRTPPAPNAPPSYSNLGMGLLGELLAIAAGEDFEAILHKEVLAPLGLNDTTVTLSEDSRARLATPHVRGSRETPPWGFDALAGAGALRSSASDLATFARAVFGARKGETALHRAIARTFEPEHAASSGSAPDQCLGWVRLPLTQHRHPTYFHDGGTLGSSSALYVVPEAGIAVVILANQGLSLWRMIKIARSRPDAIVSGLVELAAAKQ